MQADETNKGEPEPEHGAGSEFDAAGGSANESDNAVTEDVGELAAACERRAKELGVRPEDVVDLIALSLMADYGIPERIVRAAKRDADGLRGMMAPSLQIGALSTKRRNTHEKENQIGG